MREVLAEAKWEHGYKCNPQTNKPLHAIWILGSFQTTMVQSIVLIAIGKGHRRKGKTIKGGSLGVNKMIMIDQDN